MKNSFLSVITVEPTNICSLKCPGCPHGHSFFNGKKQGSMKFNNFKKIIDLNEKYFKNVRFIGIGEPFLNKSLLEMMKYCSDNGIGVSAHTNGMLIDKKIIEKFKQIKTAFRLTFSLDGISADTYGLYRIGGNFETVFENMIRLARYKKENNFSNLKIIWQFLLMRGNKHELEIARRIANKIKVDEFVVKNIVMTGDINDSRYSPIRKKETQDKKQIKQKNKKITDCEYINPGSMFVLWDGSVVPCCTDYKRENVMGNAFSESLINVWSKKKYLNFRDGYKRKVNKLCLKCRLKY